MNERCKVAGWLVVVDRRGCLQEKEGGDELLNA
jgi:hypothetical protein